MIQARNVIISYYFPIMWQDPGEDYGKIQWSMSQEWMFVYGVNNSIMRLKHAAIKARQKMRDPRHLI